MTKLKAHLVLTLSLFASACVVDADMASTGQYTTGTTVLLPVSGTGQNREVLGTFDPLVVALHDSNGDPLVNADISFSAPDSGASSSFPFGNVVQTDSEGRAKLRPYANELAGSYMVWASADGAAAMPFSLTNAAAAPAQLVGLVGMNQIRTAGLLFEQPLVVEVRDDFGNVVENTPVHFVAPDHGPTTQVMDETVFTNAQGRASTFAIAGETAGTYAVLARVAGAPSIPFVLSNMERPSGTPHATDIVEMSMNELTP